VLSVRHDGKMLSQKVDVQRRTPSNIHVVPREIHREAAKEKEEEEGGR
jgi:hypothetical protein